MELILKLCFISIFTVLVSSSIKKFAPEMVLLISVAALICFIWAGINVVSAEADKLREIFRELSHLSETIKPLIKYTGISMICQLCSALCKDGGQQGLSLGVEYLGTLASVICIFPLFNTLLDIIKQLL